VKFLSSSVAIVVVLTSLSYPKARKNTSAAKINDAKIKKILIQESIDGYPGNCPCPYNLARNGSRCGGRSAYSRSGGYSLYCFDSDITRDMIDEWKAGHRNEHTDSAKKEQNPEGE
jgi:hypothetical protein